MCSADQTGSVTAALLTLSSQKNPEIYRCHADSRIAGAETSPGAAGQWLSNPQAVMYGVDQTGAVTTVLLTLSNPTVPQQPAGTVTNNNSEFCLPQCHLQALGTCLCQVRKQSLPSCLVSSTVVSLHSRCSVTHTYWKHVCFPYSDMAEAGVALQLHTMHDAS